MSPTPTPSETPSETTNANDENVLESENGDLRVAVTEESSSRKTLEVEVAARRVKKAFDHAYRDLGREVRVKGFRPGKAPRSVLERLYGAAIPQEIERSLVVEMLPKAVKLSTLEPLIEPTVEATPPAPGEPFRFKARLELKPEISLPDLEGLPAKRPAVDVGEDEVLTQLETLREGSAPIIEVPDGTAVEEGHFVVIDFDGSLDGEPFEGGSAKGHEIEIGGGRFIPGFEEQLVGTRPGDDIKVEVTFPEDYGNDTLAGQDAVFDVHVEAVKHRVLRDLDDEFAKDQGDDFETLEDLRNSIRSDLSEERTRASDEELKRTVMDSLVERTEFDVPPGIIERQLQHQLQSFQQQYGQYVPEDVLQSQLGRMAEEGRPTAERRVREAFLLEAVGKAQGLEVSDEEVETRLDEIALERGSAPEQLRKIATEQGWHSSIRSELFDKKALDYLAERASIE